MLLGETGMGTRRGGEYQLVIGSRQAVRERMDRYENATD